MKTAAELFVIMDELLELDASAEDIVAAVKLFMAPSKKERQVVPHERNAARGRNNMKAAQFDEFWAAYPRRKGSNPRSPAEKLFAQAIAKGAEASCIVAAIRAKAGYDPDKVGTEFIPQAQTWLRNERWKDYAIPVGSDQNNAPRAAVGVFVATGTPEWEAWVAWNRAHGLVSPPVGRSGGWTFPSRLPPSNGASPVGSV